MTHGNNGFLFNFFYHYFIIIIFFIYVVTCVLLKKYIIIINNCKKINKNLNKHCSQASWEQCSSFNFFYHYFIIFFMHVVHCVKEW